MAEDSHRSSAAEITITSNGDMDQNSEKVPNRVKACVKEVTHTQKRQ